MLTRRQLLGRTAGAIAGSTFGSLSGAVFAARSAQAATHVELQAAPSTLQLADDGGPSLPVWSYNGQSPGPTLRFRVGDTARIRFRNALAQPTTVHWHGMRVPNAMDGVPGLSQTPILPGGEFLYEFPIRHPGTFWYHPHFQSGEQLDRGLSGAIVVAGDDEPEVDRDEIWVIDDWRLNRDGSVHESFGNMHDASHGGRLGNVPSVNGRVGEPFAVRAGERLRLRLVNVANARVFALQFEGHTPTVIALDGHAIEPHPLPDGRVILGPAMRVDLIVDCTEKPGSRHIVRDVSSRRPFALRELHYSDEAPLRAQALPPVSALPAPPFAEPDITKATWHQLVLEGGAMGGLREGTLRGKRMGIRELAAQGKLWALNGVVARGLDEEPWLRVERGSTHVLTVRNLTSFPHPMHLHGHPLRVLSVNGRPMPRPMWRDTVLVDPREEMELAFVADNPGSWLMHCHVPEHMDAGMLGVLEVA